MKKTIFLAALLLNVIALAQSQKHVLTIKFTGVANADGKIAIAVYNSSETYMVEGSEFFAIRVDAQKNETQVEINLPAGKYAISVFHDENDDQRLNTNFMGIPKEDYGFSNNPNSTFGPPKFEKAAFKLNGKTSVTIELN